jgi:hypothetical protein
MLLTEYDYIFDILDMEKVIVMIKQYYSLHSEEDVDDINQNFINSQYADYLKEFSKKSSTNAEVIAEHVKRIYEKTQKVQVPPKKLDQIEQLVIFDKSLSETSKNMDIILIKIFKDADLADKAKKLLESMKTEGYLDGTSELYKKLEISYSQYYGNLLKKLKSHGFIRKEGKFYILDSKFSLKRISEASAWIDFADIKRSQPTEIARIILSLFGLEHMVKESSRHKD